MQGGNSAYEKKSQRLIRISTMNFHFSQGVYPHWYPIVRDTRLCCHYHLHEHIEIIVVDEGCVTFQVSGKQYDLYANDILFINPFEPHSGYIPDEYDRTVYHAINIDVNRCKAVPSLLLKHILNDLTNGRGVYPNTLNVNQDVKKELLEYSRGMIRNCAEENELCQIANMFSFFDVVGKPTYSVNEKENKRSAEFIKTVVLYIQQTPLQDISLEAVSNMLSYNKAYFTTLFKKNFGMSFTDYVNNYKIEMAKGYIRNGNYNLNDVAIRSGFNYYAYFFKKFKSISGVSPSDFVEQCRDHNNRK